MNQNPLYTNQPFVSPQNPQSGQMPPAGQAPNPLMPGQFPLPNQNPQNPQSTQGQPPGKPPVRLPNTPPPKPKKPKQPANPKRWIVIGVFITLGIILGAFAFAQVNRYVKITTSFNFGPGDAPVIVNDTINEFSSADMPVSDSQLMAEEIDLTLLDQKYDQWDGSTRITCLAMGLDYRDWEANNNAPRSDSMMLLTYDPVTKKAGMLSIPRDLWVAIPDHGYGRINTAYSLGEAEKLPGGGPGLAIRTVEALLGIPIQYYAVIDFMGFSDFIDSIDKLAINVRDEIFLGTPINYDHEVRLYAGVQDLDGPTALAYARYRYSEGGDFERAQRQQDVIRALQKQMVWQLPQLLQKADILYAQLSKALKTNLTFNDMLKLGGTIVSLGKNMVIESSVIAPPYQVDFGMSVSGENILIPIPDKIREARDKIFSTSSAAAPVTVSDDPVELIQAEAARVSLLNGTTVQGVFEQTVAYLQQFGIQIVSTGAAANGPYNGIEILSGKPNTARFFTNTMSIPTGAVKINWTPNSEVDLIVTITDAWASSNPMPQ